MDFSFSLEVFVASLDSLAFSEEEAFNEFSASSHDVAQYSGYMKRF